ncbi:DUF3757 domain-containing protein [Pseudomonas sp. dw_612]|uniref:DUF3757 domain-containing protein n=1 Tax=Pseudomonas sp. dw_612 TaxID=2720080 RepID=UPI001BD2EDB5|nr:DUF3757 domain-containing protein [Pseudomonas sp. dw_612]
MTGNIKKISAGVVVMMAMMANAYADNACPGVDAIQQTAIEGGGFVYTASAAKGLQWTGENPMAEKNDLKAVAFKEAYVVNAKNFVACDYVGSKREGVRMALKTVDAVTPVGTAWVNETQPDGSVLPRCAGVTPEQCTFK